jgi:hypothetical protein
MSAQDKFREVAKKLAGSNMLALALPNHPITRLRREHEEYLAYCESIGVDKATADGILWGVQQITKQLPLSFDVLSEAREAASMVAAQRNSGGA